MNKIQINTINGGFIKNSMIYQKKNHLIKNINGYKKVNDSIKDAVGTLGNMNYVKKENNPIKGAVGNLKNKAYKKENNGLGVKGAVGNLGNKMDYKKENNGLGVKGAVGNLKNKMDVVGNLGNEKDYKKENNGLGVKGAVGNLGNKAYVKKKNNVLGVNGDMDGFGKEKGDMSPKFVYLYKQKFEMEAVNNKLDMNGLSPVSGYEPTYNPNYWNNNKNIKNNNNCYSYSVNNKNHKFGKPQPGYFARFNHIQNNQYKCAYFFKRILNDIPSVYLTSFKQKCKKGFTKAFFAIDSNKNEHDYHFYRQDKNKLWSHKPGTTNVINYDADYKIIKNPYTANRNYSAYNYDKPCFFFCVNNKFGKTKANI
jgi:hypothetical protein